MASFRHVEEAGSNLSGLLSEVGCRRFRGLQIIKKQRMLFRCLRAFLALFGRRFERVVAQACHDLWMVKGCRKHLVAFPAAEGNQANSKQASSFRLPDFQLEPAAPEAAAHGGRFFWNLNSTDVRWQIFVP